MYPISSEDGYVDDDTNSQEGLRRTLTMQQMQETAAYFGGQCLSTEYQGSNGKLLWKCQEGHVFKKAPNNIRREKGTFCNVCAKEDKRRGKTVLMWSSNIAKGHTLPLPRRV